MWLSGTGSDTQMSTQKPTPILYHLGGTGEVVSAFPMG
jgi:hypothetical protein